MEELLKKLESNGMKAFYLPNRAGAKDQILNMIPTTLRWA